MTDEVDFANSPLEIPYEFDFANPIDSSKHLLDEFRPELKTRLEHEKLHVQHLAGGQTNQLLVAYFGDDLEEKTLIRIYGIGTEKMIDRDGELKILTNLQKHSCAGKIYGVFKNGMCYEYVRGEALTIQSVRQERISKLIIPEIVQLHSVQEQGGIYPEFGLFERIREMVDMLPKYYKDEEKQRKFLKYFPKPEGFADDVGVLETELTKIDGASQLVFCHNDLCSGNILYDEENDKVHLIDFEYAGINYQAYDIANHFNEFAGVNDCNFSRFPDRKFQLKWLRSYLELWRELHCQLDRVTDHEVEAFYVAVQKFTLASNLFWILWSLIQAGNSTIDFDYLEYGRIRYEDYKRHFKERLALTCQNHE